MSRTLDARLHLVTPRLSAAARATGPAAWRCWRRSAGTPRQRLPRAAKKVLALEDTINVLAGRETMRRRELIALVGASVAWPFAAMAQEPGRTYHLGLLSPVPCEATPSTSPLTLAFQDELRHLGFVKDQNLTIACRDFGPNINLSSEYAAELVKGPVDVIVVYGRSSARGSASDQNDTDRCGKAMNKPTTPQRVHDRRSWRGASQYDSWYFGCITRK
jgi:hypothetical protein